MAGLLLVAQGLQAQLPMIDYAQMRPLAYSAYNQMALGPIHVLHSKALNEQRALNMYLPQGYHPDSAAGYPVVYLLDGSQDEDMLHISGIFQFMDMMEMLPPHLVVGIANTHRRHDFTQPSADPRDLELIPDAGGSAPFIDFLENEAQPYVNQAFKTDGHRTLIGQSLGGLLATEILLSKPGMFNRYIIVSPSLWWGNGALLVSAAEKIKAWPAHAHPAEVYIAVGKEGDQMEKDAAKLARVLKAAKIPGMKVDFETFPKETHATILHNAVYQTLLKIK